MNGHHAPASKRLTTRLRPVFDATVKPPYVAVRRAGVHWLERRHGIETEVVRSLEDLGIDHPERVYYAPARWRLLSRVLRRRDVGPDDVFVDFGSGMGRIVYQAAMMPFRRVVGVELSLDLHEVAVRNIERNRHKFLAGDVQLVNGDVLDFEIPEDTTIAFFNNPFNGSIFHRAAEAVFASYDARPRRLRIIYAAPMEQDWLEATGRVRLVRRSRGLRPDAEWARSNSVVMYEVLPRRTSSGPHAAS